jgi:uncharacterized protein
MAVSIDTNILVYALNRSSAVHDRAREFLESVGQNENVVLAELVLVELYLLVRNPAVFPSPYGASEAAEVCRRLRTNPSWRIVECRPVMKKVWNIAGDVGFGRRKIIDARLAYTLLAAGVTEFATRNTKDFSEFGFSRVFDPLADPN